MGYGHLHQLLQLIGLLVTEREPSIQEIKIIIQPAIFITMDWIKSEGD
jgi:hypothetical protein